MSFMPIISTAVSVLGSVSSMVGQQQKSSSKEAQLSFNADAVAMAGQRKIEQIRSDYRRIEGQQITGYGASNVAMSGSALDVMADQAMELEKEVEEARYASAIEIYNLQQQADAIKSEKMSMLALITGPGSGLFEKTFFFGGKK